MSIEGMLFEGDNFWACGRGSDIMYCKGGPPEQQDFSALNLLEVLNINSKTTTKMADLMSGSTGLSFLGAANLVMAVGME